MAETSDPDVDATAVLLAALGLLATLLCAVLLAWLGWRHWRPDGPNAPPTMAISGAPLESAPQTANSAFAKGQRAARESWGWVAGKPGVARIPVREAEALLGASGPPAFTQHPGAQLPLSLVLRDSAGRPVKLADYFGRQPVLLVLGYFRCRNLCSLVFDDVLQAALQSGASGFQLVGVSIDPAEDARDVAGREGAYRALLGKHGSAALLTGDAASTAALAGAEGFGYRYDPATGGYVHPAGFAVLTPQGRVAGYFSGLRYAPAALRAAIDGARGGHAGGLTEQVSLLCARWRADGVHGAGLWAVRAAGLAGLLLLAALLWRSLRGRRP